MDTRADTPLMHTISTRPNKGVHRPRPLRVAVAPSVDTPELPQAGDDDAPSHARLWAAGATGSIAVVTVLIELLAR